MVDFRGLNNKHLIFLYLENLSTLNDFKDMLTEKTIDGDMDLPIFGKVYYKESIPNKILNDIEKSDIYNTLLEIDGILEPIVSLIKDSDQKLYDEVENSINFKFEI